MPINFTQIVQDSWNFIRNQRNFTLMFMLIFIGILIVFQFISIVLRPEIVADVQQQMANMNMQLSSESSINAEQLEKMMGSLALATHPTILIFNLIAQVLVSFITAWGIVSIHHISQGRSFQWLNALRETLRYFFPALFINILILLPLVFGLVQSLSGSVIGLVLIVLGIYLFVRLCLAYLEYLLGHRSLGETLRITWAKSQRRFGTLFLFCLLNYVIVGMLNGQIAVLNGNIVLETIGIVLSAFLHLFTIIFSYRFYTLFMK